MVDIDVYVLSASTTQGYVRRRHVPAWVGRLFAGELGVVMMTELRGASNGKTERELGWQLRYPSWRQGFVEGLG